MAQAMPFIMAGVSAASTVVGVISNIQAGKAEEKATDRVAAQIRAAAEREAADTRKQHQRIIASQQAKYGYSGVTMEGTPLLVQMESIKESEEQLRRILESGGMKAESYEEAGKAAGTSGYVSGVKSLLSGATEVGKIGRTYDWW